MVNLKQMIFLKKNSNQMLISCILMSTGAGLVLGWTYIIKYILHFGIALRENSYLADLWQVNPMPLYLEIHMFNWTNPEEINDPNSKPKFKQIGPFVFKERKEKGNITWNPQNDTVSFKQYHTYYFDRERSVADLDFNITTLNPVLNSAAYQAIQRDWGFWMRKGMQITISQLKSKIYVTKPVGALLFDGYDDIFVTMGKSMPFIDGLPPFDKFGWFYTRNATSFEGDFNMGTAYHNYGRLERWNYDTKTTHYQGDCGKFEETSAAELYVPNLKKDKISFFSPDMCRRVPLEFEKEVNHRGVLGYKYSARDLFLDNGTIYPENKCFCPGECLPSGAVNISSCKYGAPGFVSLPNFLNADEHYRNSVEGMEPDSDRHEFQITLEPLTAIPLRVSARLQLNLYLQPVKYLTLFENVPKVLFPVLWFEQAVDLPDYLLFLMKVLLAMPATFQITGTLLMLIGVFLISRLIYAQIIQSVQQYSVCDTEQQLPEKKKTALEAATPAMITVTELVPLNQKVDCNCELNDEHS